MTNHKTTHILAHLIIEYRTDAVHLKDLEKDLIATMLCVRKFGEKHGSPDEWNTQWNEVEGILHRTGILVNEMHDSIESNDSGRKQKVLAAWKTIQSEDVKLVKALAVIRAQASALNAALRRDWNVLARTFEPHLETIYACAQTLRIKLELLDKYSTKEVDRFVQCILSKLPIRADADRLEAETYEREYDKAIIELEQEQHEFRGFLDLIKSFWQWFETPEERMFKNRSLRVDEAEFPIPASV